MKHNAHKGGNDMINRPADASTSSFRLGKEQADAMLSIQKEFLDAYEQASRAWLARVKSEVDLWSALATKLSTTRSVPEAMSAYQECVAQRMQMAAEDGQRMLEDCQKITQQFTRSLSNGWTPGST
jgi:Phasin protein